MPTMPQRKGREKEKDIISIGKTKQVQLEPIVKLEKIKDCDLKKAQFRKRDRSHEDLLPVKKKLNPSIQLLNLKEYNNKKDTDNITLNNNDLDTDDSSLNNIDPALAKTGLLNYNTNDSSKEDNITHLPSTKDTNDQIINNCCKIALDNCCETEVSTSGCNLETDFDETDEGSVWSDDESVMESDLDSSNSNTETDLNNDDLSGIDEENIILDDASNDVHMSVIRNISFQGRPELPNFSGSSLTESQFDKSAVVNSTTLFDPSRQEDATNSIAVSDKNDPDYTLSNEHSNEVDKENDPLVSNVSNKSNRKSDEKNLNTSKPHKINISKKCSLKKNNPSIKQLDYKSIKVLMANKNTKDALRIRKKHLCPYCNKDFVKLKQHLLRKHKSNEEVERMRASTSQNKGSRQPMKALYAESDLVYNTNADINKGDLRVARAPVCVQRLPEDFTVCNKCKITILSCDFRKHYRRCSGKSNKDCRNLSTLGRIFITFCSTSASQILKEKIIAFMRNDKYTKALRYDDLIIQYGNQICSHLRGPQHKGNIVTQIRRLARLKVTMTVEELSDIFLLDSLKVVEAIEVLANENGQADSDFISHPTVARNLNTLVRAVHNTYTVMLYKRKASEDLQKNVDKWLKCFDNDYKTHLSRITAESRGIQIRRQKNELPLQEDITLLHAYLSNICTCNYNILYKGFDEEAYINLLKSCLTKLQVTNSRRPGDMERIYLSDYDSMEQINNVAKDEYVKLSENIQCAAKKYFVLRTRGKLGRNIKVLLPPKIKIYIDKLIEFRSKLDISPTNKYLFALPKTSTSIIRYPSAYVLLSRFAKKCGASKPHLLRATKLRKHMATACIELDLNDGELNDLAGFMGHHVDIHKKHYRQNLVAREIPLMIKFINAATGNLEDNDMSDNEISPKNDTVYGSTESEEDAEDSLRDTEMQDVEESIKKPVLGDSPGHTKGKKAPYTNKEKEVLLRTYSGYINGSDPAPSLNDLRELLANNRDIFLKERRDRSLKSYLYNLKKNH